VCGFFSEVWSKDWSKVLLLAHTQQRELSDAVLYLAFAVKHPP